MCGRKELLVSLLSIVSLIATPLAVPAQDPGIKSENRDATKSFPPELVAFTPYAENPVFAGTGTDSWDRMIRERGYVLYENNRYHLWYTGYRGGGSDTKLLGYAVSEDGIRWQRDPHNPIFTKSWVEDMCVVRHADTYYMFAEGLHDIAHLLTSTDRRTWHDQGSLDVRQTNGEPIEPGPYGTPTVWIEDGTWYLFYERRDAGVWLATSRDRQFWTNVQDQPVLARGPERYDQQAVAMNQVIQYKGRYYGYYHATAHEPWKDWTTNVAVSDDLIHWTKFAGNPIVTGNKSSGIVVYDGQQWRLYTMHPDVRVYFQRK